MSASLISRVIAPATVALSLLSAPAAPAARAASAADLDRDGAVDAADAQALLRAVAARGALDPALDLSGDGSVGLEDALLFGRWVNGLWEKPAAGFGALHFGNPEDEAAFRKYRGDVQANRSLAWDALATRYPERPAPAPAYAAGTVEFADSVANALRRHAPSLDKAAFLAQVHREGMAVSRSAEFPNYFQALDFIHGEDLPLLFTTDALLHTVYLSYDNILIELEQTLFIPSLERILADALAYAKAHHGAGDAGRDVRSLLETALLLLKPEAAITPTPEASAHLADVRGLEFKPVTLFGRDTVVDFSQFKPRGHYTRTPDLEKYFQAMMWLSRADLAFDLRARDAQAPNAHHTRMKKGAWILWDAVVGSGSLPAWLEMNRLLEYLVGRSDGLTMKGMGTVAHALQVRKVPEYLAAFDAAAEARFDAALAASGLGIQAILSQGQVFGPGGKLDLPPILSFMPQRFILDSYTFSQLVHPEASMRAMPSSLDIAFALGDNSALADMPVAGRAPAGLLAAQRSLYDGISEAGWKANLYTSWLDFLRKLGPAPAAAAPAFRTAAWNRKMRNTRLASWAQLRRNTILYSKQSYTGGTICEFPRAYVEPYPEFFRGVAAYAAKGKALFQAGRPALPTYFAGLEDIAKRLAEVAEGAAAGRQPTDAQSAWLRTALSSRYLGICGAGRVYDGWYRGLIYGSLQEQAEVTRDYSIADVHTKPYNDEMGPSQVLHAATGRISLMAVAVKLDTCVSMFVGPVASFYDVRREGLVRLDEKFWIPEVDKKGPDVARPAWMAPVMGP